MNDKYWFIIVYFIFGTLLILMFLSDDQKIESRSSLCPMKVLTGLPCPGCGITKSIYFFCKGDIVKSFSYHIYGPLLLFALLLFPIYKYWQKASILRWIINMKSGCILISLLLCWHLLRTIDFLQEKGFSGAIQESVWAHVYNCESSVDDSIKH